MRLVVVRSLTGMALYSAAVEAGVVPAAPTAFGIANLADIPEVAPGPLGTSVGAELLGNSEAIADLNQVLHPFHPRVYEPQRRDRYALTARLIASIGYEIDEIIVPAVASRPAATVLDLLPHVPVTAIPDSLAYYSDGGTPRSTDLARLTSVVHGLPGAPDGAVKGAQAARLEIPHETLRAVLARGRHSVADHLDSTVILENSLMRGPAHRGVVSAAGAFALGAHGDSPMLLALDPEAPPRHLPPVTAAYVGEDAAAALSTVAAPQAHLAEAARHRVIGAASWELCLAAALGSSEVTAIGPDGSAHQLTGEAARDLALLGTMRREARRVAAPPAGSRVKRGVRRLGRAVLRRAREALA